MLVVVRIGVIILYRPPRLFWVSVKKSKGFLAGKKAHSTSSRSHPVCRISRNIASGTFKTKNGNKPKIVAVTVGVVSRFRCACSACYREDIVMYFESWCLCAR